MAKLFEPLKIREITFKNRIVMSPMCQYSATDGMPNDWHLVHVGSRAVGGAGAVIVEATAVAPEGRISPADLGLWNDSQAEAFRRLTTFIKSHGCVPAVQLAHGGRKAGTAVPWEANNTQKHWEVVGPSPLPFSPDSQIPRELSSSEIQTVAEAFGAATKRALLAGFEVVEIHAAHGYLLNEFLSPLSNKRKDEYGGSFENRTRLILQVARKMRSVWPESRPLFLRLSVTEWVEGGWDVESSIALARLLHKEGVDLIDCSTGGNIYNAQIPAGPGYQVPFSSQVKKGAGILTGTVGIITSAMQAEQILRNGDGDLILLGREFLRNPYWALKAASELGDSIDWPKQYLRAAPATAR